MLNPIKKLFQATDVKVNQDKQAIELSEKEMKAIIGAGSRNGTLWADPF